MCVWAEPIKTNLVGGTLRSNTLTFDFLYGVRKKRNKKREIITLTQQVACGTNTHKQVYTRSAQIKRR